MKAAVRDYKRDDEIIRLRDELHWSYTKKGVRYTITKSRARDLYIRASNDIKRSNKKLGIGGMCE